MPRTARSRILVERFASWHETLVVDSAEVVSVELAADEFRLLTTGLWQWGGPGYCSDAMAVAMGFDDAERMLDDIQLMLKDLKSSLRSLAETGLVRSWRSRWSSRVTSSVRQGIGES